MTLARMPEPDGTVLDRSGAIIKELEALIGAGVLLLAIWFVTFAYDRTQRGGVSDGYTISARFPNTSGVSVGTDVRVSGLKVGTVADETLDTTTYQAVLKLTIDSAVKLPLDTSAAITRSVVRCDSSHWARVSSSTSLMLSGSGRPSSMIMSSSVA